MGGVGWRPVDFYEAEISDSLDALVGYIESKRDDERIQRRAAIMIVSPWIDKKIDPYKWWPIAGDDNDRESIQQLKRQKALDALRKHRHKEALKKHNGN